MALRLISLLGIVLLAGCNLLEEQDSDIQADVATYEGILPGMQCDRARVQLTLDSRDFHYQWQETPLDEDGCGEALETRGRWTIEQARDNPEAVLYQLDPGRDSGPRNFLRIDARQIKMVDEHGEEFWRPYNLILERKAEKLPADDPF